MNLLPEKIIANRYKIIKILGQGGYAITYEAKDLQTNQIVAIKELSLRQISDWKVLDLFEREAKILALLNHPKIPKYLDYFQVDIPDNRYFYLVQELAVGKSLAELIESGCQLSENEVRKIAIQILEILCYLQQLIPPVIHRDIKPANIICGEDWQVFLVDFGAVTNSYRQTLMGGSTSIGTFGYMAPEQFRGRAIPSTDLYGLGATLLFLLTHRSPADLPQNRMKINFRSQVQISSEFAEWLEVMLEPMEEDRFTSAQQANDILQGKIEAIESLIKKPQKQPVGSNVTLKNTGNKLLIDIPSDSLINNLGMIIFATIWIGFIYFWTFTAITTGAPWIFPIFSIPFWIAGMVMIGSVIYNIATFTHLEIDTNLVRIQWKFLGFKWQVKIPVENIDRLELNSQYSENDRPIFDCTFVAGVKMHRFGSRLSNIEKEWLIEKIGNFLQKPVVKEKVKEKS